MTDATVSAPPPSVRVELELSLETSIRRFKVFEYIAAGVVVVGVVKEYWEPFSAAFWNGGLWPAIGLVWGGAAVALGVAAETLFSMLVSSAETKLHKIDLQRRSEAEEKTGEALHEAAKANLLAEQERCARLKMEREMAWREINPEQQETIIERLHNRFQGQVYVVAGSDDSEPSRFAEIINSALIAAKWDSTKTLSKPRRILPIPGVYIVSTTDDASQQAAQSIGDLFSGLGFAASVRIDRSGDYSSPPYWPEEIYNFRGPKVFIVVRDRPSGT